MKPVVIVLDNGPIHITPARLQRRRSRRGLTRRGLPTKRPESNDIEVVWGDFKARLSEFHRVEALDVAVQAAVKALNEGRKQIRYAVS